MPLEPKSLDDLAELYATDKGPTTHHYTRVYEQLLQQYRGDSVRLLEIGVLMGASLRMWRDYFPNGYIVGMDNDLKIPEERRINLFYGDQGRAVELIDLGKKHGPFDIIIDDGSHQHAHQMISFYTLFPEYLNPGGLYFIEDVHEDHLTKRYFRRCFDCIPYGDSGGIIMADSVEFLHGDNLIMVKKWAKTE